MEKSGHAKNLQVGVTQRADLLEQAGGVRRFVYCPVQKLLWLCYKNAPIHLSHRTAQIRAITHQQ